MKINYLMLVLLISTLSACSGGGDNNSNSTYVSPTPVVEVTTLKCEGHVKDTFMRIEGPHKFKNLSTPEYGNSIPEFTPGEEYVVFVDSTHCRIVVMADDSTLILSVEDFHTLDTGEYESGGPKRFHLSGGEPGTDMRSLITALTDETRPSISKLTYHREAVRFDSIWLESWRFEPVVDEEPPVVNPAEPTDPEVPVVPVDPPTPADPPEPVDPPTHVDPPVTPTNPVEPPTPPVTPAEPPKASKCTVDKKEVFKRFEGVHENKVVYGPDDGTWAGLLVVDKTYTFEVSSEDCSITLYTEYGPTSCSIDDEYRNPVTGNVVSAAVLIYQTDVSENIDCSGTLETGLKNSVRIKRSLDGEGRVDIEQYRRQPENSVTSSSWFFIDDATEFIPMTSSDMKGTIWFELVDTYRTFHITFDYYMVDRPAVKREYLTAFSTEIGRKILVKDALIGSEYKLDITNLSYNRDLQGCKAVNPTGVVEWDRRSIRTSEIRRSNVIRIECNNSLPEPVTFKGEVVSGAEGVKSISVSLSYHDLITGWSQYTWREMLPVQAVVQDGKFEFSVPVALNTDYRMYIKTQTNHGCQVNAALPPNQQAKHYVSRYSFKDHTEKLELHCPQL